MHKRNRHSTDSSCNRQISSEENIIDAQAQPTLETSQAGSGTLLEEQTIPQNLQQESLYQQNVTIENYNYVISYLYHFLYLNIFEFKFSD